jgi:hypothetical protein
MKRPHTRFRPEEYRLSLQTTIAFFVLGAAAWVGVALAGNGLLSKFLIGVACVSWLRVFASLEARRRR